MKHKVVYNSCFGGFSLSKEASRMLNEIKGEEVVDMKYGYLPYDGTISRHDKDLVYVVETLGSKRASGMCAELSVIEISGNLYNIEEYDGSESVYTPEGYSWTIIEEK